LPNALWRQPQASLESRAKSNGGPQGAVLPPRVLSRAVLSRGALSWETQLLQGLRKDVFPGYQFVGELKSLLLEL